MAVPLDELLPSLKASLNVPGAAKPLFNFDDDDAWIEALANGFWFAWARGFYRDFKLDVDSENIVNVAAGDDLPRGDQQVIVIFTALEAIRASMLTMFSTTRDKAGPVETERQRSSTLLKQLLDDRRAELEDIRQQMVLGGNSTTVHVIDAVMARSGMWWSDWPPPWIL